MTTSEIVAQAEPGVALIKGQLGRGTGFLVRGGILATNAHVIGQEMIRSLEVHFPSAPLRAVGPFRPRLLYEDSRRDLALLRVETDLAPLKIAKSYRFRRGEDVTIIGNPGVGGEVILQNAISRGILSTEANLGGHRFYQLGASVNPGNSGGPAIDSHGEVIGIVTAKAKVEEAIGFCIPVEDLTAAMGRVDPGDAGRRARAERNHDLGAVFRRVRLVCQSYSRALELYASAIKGAIELGRDPGDGVQAAARVIGDRPLSLDRAMIDEEVKAELARAIRDLDLPADLRRDFRELWDAYIEIRNCVAQPRGTAQGLLTRIAELADRMDHAVRGLELGLSIEEERL
jgi:serine protease Do